MNEPVRKSYFDLVKDNMKAANRAHLITRLVYFGTYQGTDTYLQMKFQTVINHLRSNYSNVPLTGLLLVYPQYFMHIIETTEELIFRHLDAIFYDEEKCVDLGRVLSLPLQHHVYHCFFSKWLKVSTKAPQLLEKLDDPSTTEVKKQLNNCLVKVYTFCEYLLSCAHGNLGAVENVLKNLTDSDQRYLPESTVLEFLLKSNSPILRDLREYVDIAKVVPFFRLYNENIWPPPCDFMPHDIFVEHISRRDLMLQRLSQQPQFQRETRASLTSFLFS